MKAAERDELLIRLDVRTENIEKTTEKQEQHLATLNDKVNKNLLNIDRAAKRLDNVESKIEGGLGIKLSRKQIVIGGTGTVPFIVLVLLELGKAVGWW